MGAKHSREIPEKEFVFENPLLPKTFQLPTNEEEIKPKIEEKVDNKPESVSTFPTPETKNIEDIEANAYKDISNKENTNNNTDGNNVEPENSTPNDENADIPQSVKPIEEEVKKVKKIKFNEEPLPSDEWYKPLMIEKADEILSSEAIENIIEEHVKEEINIIKKEQKIRNFKRDKLLERTINTIKYGNSSINYKDINDKFRKSQKKVVECMSNNESCTLSERDIACYQEFEEFKDNLRMLYRKYYNA